MNSRPRVLVFDVLRGIAIILVLGRHMAAPDNGVSGSLKYMAALWMQIGWTGVDLFFVLSGFLVSGLLFSEYQRHGSLDILRFLIRRGFKIYPGFYFLISVTVLLLSTAGSLDGLMTAKLWAEVFYFQNYLPGLWNHTWSLAVEEHFYLILAVSLYLVGSRQRHEPQQDPFRRFVSLAILGLLAIAAIRSFAPHVAPYIGGKYVDPIQLRFETHVRIDTLTVGVILSYFYHFHRVRFTEIVQRHRALIVVASAVLLTPPFFWPLGHSWLMPSVGLLCIALGFACILATGLALGEPIRSPHRAVRPLLAVLAFVGFHSYSVYLWHMPVQVILMPALSAALLPTAPPPDVAFLFNTSLYMIAAVIVGVCIGRVIEQPALSLRDRLFPTRAGRLAADTQHLQPERINGHLSPPLLRNCWRIDRRRG